MPKRLASTALLACALFAMLPGTVVAQAGECRTYPTSAVNVTRGGPSTVTLAYSGSFDASTFQTTYEVTYTNSAGPSFTYTQVTTYGSTSDVLDEVAVIPPRTRSLRTVGKGSISFELTNQYDAQGRLTGFTNQSGGSTVTVTYSAWDDDGRPTAGISSAAGPITIGYDPATRTSTTRSSAGTEAQTYDEDGNPSSLVQSYAGVVATTTTTLKDTAQVCR